MQHLVAWTSSYEPLIKSENSEWKTNAAGFKVSLRNLKILFNTYVKFLYLKR